MLFKKKNSRIVTSTFIVLSIQVSRSNPNSERGNIRAE